MGRAFFLEKNDGLCPVKRIDMAKQLDLLDKSIPPWKMIVLLAWPTVVEQLLQTAVNYVDTAMVGSIDTSATAAVSVCSPAIWLLMGLTAGAAVGYSVIVARRIGEGRTEDARETIRQSVLAAGVIGLALTLAVELVIAPNLPYWMKTEEAVARQAVGYFRIVGAANVFQAALMIFSRILRCVGDAKTPLKFNILTNVINVVGNYMLIYPSRQVSIGGWSFTLHRAGMGVAGAALATAAATAFSGGALLLVLFYRKAPTQIHLGESFRPNKEIIRQAVRLGLPSFFERATISVGQVISTFLISGLGTVALAAHQLSNSAESICYMPAFGVSIAATTLVAQHLGAGEKERAYQYGRLCAMIGMGIMVVTGGTLFALAPRLIRLFTRDAAVIALGSKVLRIQALAEPLVGAGNVLSGVFSGAGDTRWPFFVSVIGMWLIRLPLAAILIFGFYWDLTAVWLGMALDWAARGSICLIHFFRRRWLNAWELRERKAI